MLNIYLISNLIFPLGFIIYGLIKHYEAIGTFFFFSFNLGKQFLKNILNSLLHS